MPVHSLKDLKGDDDGEGGVPPGAMDGPVDGEKLSKWFMNIYHEKQIGGLCASHCMNNLLQEAVFDEVELSEIGLDLDRRERAAGLGGMESQNVRADGFFSVQVISSALQRKGLTTMMIGSEEAKEAKKNPTKEVGFILNRSEHWFALRRLGGYWFDLNSTYQKPKVVSDTYLSMLLQQMTQDGYSVFVVRGSFPPCKAESDRKALEAAVFACGSGASGQLKTGAATPSVNAFSGAGYSMAAAPPAPDESVAAALAASGVDANTDPELAAAIAESLKAAAPPAEAPLDPAEEMRRKRLARFGG